MIRRAKIGEIHEIIELTRACTQKMINNGIYQWNAEYPSRKAFITDIKRKELYVLPFDEKIAGIIAVTPVMDQEYLAVKWLTENNNNIYIHRLAVHPRFQGRGFARKLMDFAEGRARENVNISVRLDTFSRNFRNQQFYEQRGYVKTGHVFFTAQSEDPFYCYELVL